jgi:membrane-bound serine protease (ClpP class)
VDRVAPTIGDHLVNLPGVSSREVHKSGETRREPRTRVIVSGLPLTHELFHTAASPAVTYLMLGIGIGLLIFEFFTAGIGIAGVVGAVALLLGGYGLGVLPHRGWALGLVILAGLAFMIDVQAGIPRFWTTVGLGSWIVGSIFLFQGLDRPWIALGVGIVGMAIAMISGMPAMVRARFGTPTIGREWMIGAEGTALSAVAPEGTVVIDGAQWRARTNRATPIDEGATIRVVSIDGLTLEVEPEEGGAIDYREMRRSRGRS